MKKQNDDITVKGLLDIFLPKFWIAILVSVVLAVLVGAYSFVFKPDTYTSRGKYMFTKINYNDPGALTGLTTSEISAMQGMISNAQEIIDTKKFSIEVEKRLHEYTYCAINKEYAYELGYDDAALAHFKTAKDFIKSADTKIKISSSAATQPSTYFTLDEDEDGNPAYYTSGGELVAYTFYGMPDDAVVEGWQCNEVAAPFLPGSTSITPERIRGMMRVTLVSADTTCYYFSVTSTDPEISLAIAEVAGDLLVEKYEDDHNYAIKILTNEEPVLPVAPNSKHVARNAAIAFAAGLLVTLLVIFVASRFDVVIRSREKIEENFDIPILGVIPRLESNDLAESKTSKEQRKGQS